MVAVYTHKWGGVEGVVEIDPNLGTFLYTDFRGFQGETGVDGGGQGAFCVFYWI